MPNSRRARNPKLSFVPKRDERNQILLNSDERIMFQKLLYPNEYVELQRLYEILMEERRFYKRAKPGKIE